jgi:Fe-S-cluster containining protein
VAEHDEENAYGTVPPDAPATRADLERAIRGLNSSDMLLKDQLLALAAQVVALTDELTRRLDGVEPLPAPPNTPAEPHTTTIEAAVAARTPDALAQVRANDAGMDERICFDLGGDKYEAEPATPPCAELIPICEARCCKLRFALSTQDLDEGVIRWDYGRPYMIRQRESDGRCVHNDPGTHFCTVHEVRPRICRTYHCQDDPRIWKDYANRVPAPPDNREDKLFTFDLMERARARSVALFTEREAIERTYPERAPKRGPGVDDLER